MTLNEIYLDSGCTEKLIELTEEYNRTHSDKRSFQEQAEEILQEAIYIKWIESRGAGVSPGT